MKRIFDNKQRTEEGSEWSANENINKAKANGSPISDDAYRCNLLRWHAPEKAFLQ